MLVKRVCPVLAGTIAAICNVSFAHGILPTSHKHAIVQPRLKIATLDPNDLNSYRPISNLSFLSKTIERVVAIRINEHADAYRLMPLRQSAYRGFHSTETAVTDVHNRLIRCVDRGGNVSVLVLLDLSSAFDTVDHVILLEILEKRFGVASDALSWYYSYLSEHTQTYKIG